MTPGMPYVPLINMMINILLMVKMDVNVWILLLAWLSCGFFIYFFYGIRNSLENPKNKNGDVELAK